MRRRVLQKSALAAVAGGIVTVVAWRLGPAVGVPVVLGLGTAGGLLALDQLRGGLRTTNARAGTAHRDTLRALGHLQETVDRSIEETVRNRQNLGGVEKRLKESAARDFAQFEALLNLHRLVPVQSGMPSTRGWAASPDLLLLLVSLVEQHRPATVVDLGSGSTTLWMATAMRTYGVEGRIIALDHDAKYARLTREALVAHGLEKFAEVRHAPLTDLDLAGEPWPWYDVAALADVAGVDLLVVDGPPGVLRKDARYPALPVLADRLAPHARIVLDDYGRAEEKEIVVQWRQEYPGWTLRELPHEKGTALLSRD